VIGHPVSHSRSPAMQNAALADLGLADDWRYEAIDVDEDGFSGLITTMPLGGFVGANITVPHKHAALEIAEQATDSATAIGAANTLIFTPAGTVADNTDAPGLIDSLPEPVAGKKVLVFGAGGAGRAVLWALLAEGAEVSVWNRNPVRAENLVKALGGTAVTDPDAEDFDLFVNSSAAGLGGRDGLADLPVSAGDFNASQVVVDMVYGDEPSSLLEAASKAGAATVDGLEILVRQGARSLEIWTGMKPSLEVMRTAARGAS
jgi:shikimate dehydrogenase